MARVTITFTDDPADSSLSITSEPTAAELGARVDLGGVRNLSPAQQVALSTLVYISTHVKAIRERASIQVIT